MTKSKSKFELVALCLLSTSLVATKIWAQSSPTSPAQGFNMIVRNNAQFNSSEMEGPLAIGGNLILSGNYNVNIHNHGSYQIEGVNISLLVNGTVLFNSGNSFQVQNGYVKIGNCGNSVVWYHDPNNATPPIRITPNSNYNSSPRIELNQNAPTLGVSATQNPVCETVNLNFNNAFLQFQNNSESLHSCIDNAILKNSNGVLLGRTNLPNQVKIYLQSGVNILNISSSELNAVQELIFDGQQPDANHYLIINVDAPGSFNWDVYNSAGYGGTSNCQYILYNFYNTNLLNIVPNSSSIEGTIFAPYAAVTKNNNSNLEGQVIAQSYLQTAGGEVHYAPFLPTYGGCTIVSQTESLFSVNDPQQCLSGNSFSFTNLSTGVGLSYQWDFGDGTTSTEPNPIKTYSLPGSYLVKLITVGGHGADTSTQEISVYEEPNDTILVDTTILPLSSNIFHFSASSNNSSATYHWDFGDGSTTVESTPSKSYNQAGSYNVLLTTTNINRCSSSSNEIVYVTSDSVGSGHDSGLESVSLGGLVGRRDFNKLKFSVPSNIDYAEFPTFIHDYANRPTGDAQSLQDIIPDHLAPGMVLRVTSPEDILYLTQAKNVVSVDYTMDGKAQAVVLGIETYQKAYSHTKSTCDRFKGAKLLKIDSVNISGFPFLRFRLKTTRNNIEYAIAFVVGKSTGQNFYSLQTNWLISKFHPEDTLFNMQIWSTRPDYTDQLVADILQKLQSYQKIILTQYSPVPPAFVTYGKRDLGNLVVSIANATDKEDGELVFEERKNELSGIELLKIPVTLVKGENNVFKIPVKDGYEYQGALYLNDTLVDEVYMADGNWGLDFDKKYTTITQYTIENHPDRIYKEGSYPLYRSSNIEVNTTDYITVYKAISSGTEPTDLTKYQSLRFIASGSDSVLIKITKASIADWNAQYQFTLNLTKEPKEYAISLSDFRSSTIKSKFNPNDLKTISFTILNKSGEERKVNLNISDAYFSIDSATSILALRSKKLILSPNPSQGEFTCQFSSTDDAFLELSVSDISGRVILNQTVRALKGFNSLRVNVPSGPGIFIVSLEGKKIRYESQKLIIKE